MIRSKWTALLMAGILSISSIGMPVFAAESGMAEELPDEIIEEPEETAEDVVVSIRCGSRKNYMIIKDRVEELAEEIDGEVSVKL